MKTLYASTSISMLETLAKADGRIAKLREHAASKEHLVINFALIDLATDISIIRGALMRSVVRDVEVEPVALPMAAE